MIRILRDGALLAAPFLDLTGQVATGYEQGLLGLAFDPGYSTNGRFFVTLTDPAGDLHVVRYQVSSDPDRADAASGDDVLYVDGFDDYHYAGMLEFGPDGYLYVAIGDGNGGNVDEDGHGQSTNDLFGSILRIDVSGASGYTIPSGNPFSDPDRPEIWSYGLRNPWRFSFDRGTGDLYIGDVGLDDREEIDVAPASSGAGRGANFGWKILEGTRCVDGASCDRTGKTPPALEYGHPEGCVVIGGFVYRGAAIPSLRGTYFYGDHCGGWVRSFRYLGGTVTSQTEWPSLDAPGQITSFGQDAAGELYVLTDQGAVFRIVPARAAATAALPTSPSIRRTGRFGAHVRERAPMLESARSPGVGDRGRPSMERRQTANLGARSPGSKWVNVVVETPAGSRNKYKYDEALGLFRLYKMLPIGAAFPFDFGFIPGTRGEDGDPLDVLIIGGEPTFVGCLVTVRLLGVLEAEQTEKGKTIRNDRLIATAETPKIRPEARSLAQVSPRMLDQIEHFFAAYNRAEGRDFVVVRRSGPGVAARLVERGVRAGRRA